MSSLPEAVAGEGSSVHAARQRQSLSTLDRLIIRELARVRFATREQFAHWYEIDASTVSRHLNCLLASGYLLCHSHSRPAVWGLSLPTAQLMQPEITSWREPSWAVMANACHANQAEIELGMEHKGFQMAKRLSLLKQGLHPVLGEYGAMDGDNISYLVLVDDYRMQSRRMEKAWTRRHTPSAKFWADPTGRCWRDVVNQFYVVSTDSYRTDAHRFWSVVHRMPAKCLSIAPLWRL